MLNPNLNLLSLSLQMLKCMFLILRGIVMKKRLIFLGKTKVKELLKNFMLKNQCLDLVLSIKENLNIFLLVTIMVWLVTLDPIVCSWDLNLKSKLNWLQESKVDLSHVFHHCGVPSHTRPSCFKLHPKKWVSKLSKVHDPIPSVEELLKALSFLTWFQGNVIPSPSFQRFDRTCASSSS